MNRIDPDGLEERVINGYSVQDIGGHHRIPTETWAETGFDSNIYRIWDESTARVYQPDGSGHNYARHGAKYGYTAHVQSLLRQELQAFVACNGQNGSLTLRQQEEFARGFLKKIEAMPKNTYIGGFNDAVKRGGTEAVRSWWQSAGSKIAAPNLGKPTSIAGTVTAKANAGIKVGGRALSVYNAMDTAEMAHDALIKSMSDDGRIHYQVYEFEDKHGTYHYEQECAGPFILKTDAVYDTGAKAGEHVGVPWFWGKIKVFFKRFINPPPRGEMHEVFDKMG